MFDPVYRHLFEQMHTQLLILIPLPKEQQYSSAKVTHQETKSNCLLNFKKEHLLGVHQTTPDVAKSNSYQSQTHNIIAGVHFQSLSSNGQSIYILSPGYLDEVNFERTRSHITFKAKLYFSGHNVVQQLRKPMHEEVTNTLCLLDLHLLFLFV